MPEYFVEILHLVIYYYNTFSFQSPCIAAEGNCILPLNSIFRLITLWAGTELSLGKWLECPTNHPCRSKSQIISYCTMVTLPLGIRLVTSYTKSK
ncbi:MAG: hypothetical protein U0V54_05870 [Saprospiraceae bacterium]